MSSSDEDIHFSRCFICKENFLPDSETDIVKERGIKTFISASERRDDGHVNLIRQLKKVKVHQKCRKLYTNEKAIKAAINKPKTIVAEADLSVSQSGFDFESKCFFCGENITAEFLEKEAKKSRDKRNVVYKIHNANRTKGIIAAAENHQDDYWTQKVLSRIEGIDLHNKGAQYHQKCYAAFCRPVRRIGAPSGRPNDPNIIDKMEVIFTYLENNREECQFSIGELRNVIKDPPCDATIKTKLEEKYGDDIVITCLRGRPTTICFRDTGHRLLVDSWYNKDKKDDLQEERLRIVRAAATIIREDIRAQVYENDYYPKPENFLESAESDIPETLNELLDGIIMKGKKNSRAKYKTHCTSIAHSIISSTRPKSFLSCIHTAVASYLHERYGSKHLIELLAALGYCASYSEVSKFQISVVLHPDTETTANFSQWVADNADVNVNTLDGLNTFHSMGVIECQTPAPSHQTNAQGIFRVTDIPCTTVIGNYGNVPLQIFEKHEESGHKKIIIKEIENKDPILPTVADVLWMYGKSVQIPNLVGWNGFMEKLYKTNAAPMSEIVPQPFINAPPSDYNTVYTTLLCTAEKCMKKKQRTCFITFDQPLFLKAHDIVSSKINPLLDNVVVRLGGFHLLMSFLGSIGYIMSGSGLKELLILIYAPGSVDKMMTGHAYSRAIRGHFLAQVALGQTIIQSVEFSEEERDEMELLILDILDGDNPPMFDVEPFQTIRKRFLNKIEEIRERGPTSQLWIQYFEMVTLVKLFIKAERTGDWNLHLNTIEKMLPFFHASGHFNYALSAQLYLQEMKGLQAKMTPREYRQFVTNGYFTIRRSDKFWSGIWSDMTIEQTLMRLMKSTGGLTRGRGITDSVLAKWVLGMPIMHRVSEALEIFADVSSASTEQHVDVRPARITRDNADVDKLCKWISTYKPLAPRTELVSLGDGTVGGSEITCYKAREIGFKGMQLMVGNNYADVSFSHKNRALPLSAIKSSVKIQDDRVPINVNTIYRRISFAKTTQEQLKSFFKYELAPFPLSLFDENGFRKSPKAQLYQTFTALEDNEKKTILKGDVSYVIDGGFLLHKVVWHKGNTFSAIADQYTSYVLKHYGQNTVVVFDGYPEDITKRSTKSAERQRRAKKVLATEILFDESMTCVVKKEDFLLNERNKSRLIALLMNRFPTKGIEVKQHEEDADVLIVQTALQRAQDLQSVVIVGNDIDLLVILTGIATAAQQNVYFLKPGVNKVPSALYSPSSFKHAALTRYILLFHAFSGCDTTSSIFYLGKLKLIDLFKTYDHLQQSVAVFYDEHADPDEIDEAGREMFKVIYGGKHEDSLNTLRYNIFSRSMTKSEFNLANIPPCEAAARQHSFRCYHQIQKWLGNNKPCEEWGWKQSPHGLIPIYMLKEPAPPELLKFISCKCKKGCDKQCGCRKAGLRCSSICYNCQGQSCNNVQDMVEEEEEDDVEEEHSELAKFLTQSDIVGNPFDPHLISDLEALNANEMEESEDEKELKMQIVEAEEEIDPPDSSMQIDQEIDSIPGPSYRIDNSESDESTKNQTRKKFKLA